MKSGRNYQNGAAFERQCKRDLEASGYAVVRSAGSHSPADLVALRKGGGTLGIQCKRNGRLDPDEWNEFVGWCASAGIAPILAEKVRGGIEYHLITGKKDGSRKQPMCGWEPPYEKGSKE